MQRPACGSTARLAPGAQRGGASRSTCLLGALGPARAEPTPGLCEPALGSLSEPSARSLSADSCPDGLPDSRMPCSAWRSLVCSLLRLLGAQGACGPTQDLRRALPVWTPGSKCRRPTAKPGEICEERGEAPPGPAQPHRRDLRGGCGKASKPPKTRSRSLEQGSGRARPAGPQGGRLRFMLAADSARAVSPAGHYRRAWVSDELSQEALLGAAQARAASRLPGLAGWLRLTQRLAQAASAQVLDLPLAALLGQPETASTLVQCLRCAVAAPCLFQACRGLSALLDKLRGGAGSLEPEEFEAWQQQVSSVLQEALLALQDRRCALGRAALAPQPRWLSPRTAAGTVGRCCRWHARLRSA